MIGHRGAYYLALTDLDGVVLRICLTLLEGAAVFLKKMPEITCAEPEIERQEQLAELERGFDLLTGALADLEIIFPLHWNGIVIHWLLHQLEEVIHFGRFSAVNMLVIERLHVKLKAMMRGGTVNPSRTLANKMSAFHDAEHWRLVNSKRGGGKKMKRLSSIASNVAAATAERKTEATTIGKGLWVKLPPRQFQLLLAQLGQSSMCKFWTSTRLTLSSQRKRGSARWRVIDWWNGGPPKSGKSGSSVPASSQVWVLDGRPGSNDSLISLTTCRPSKWQLWAMPTFASLVIRRRESMTILQSNSSSYTRLMDGRARALVAFKTYLFTTCPGAMRQGRNFQASHRGWSSRPTGTYQLAVFFQCLAAASSRWCLTKAGQPPLEWASLSTCMHTTFHCGRVTE